MRCLIPSCLILLMLPCAIAADQRVYWEPNAGSLAYGQASPLQLVFENCEPDGDPKLPPSTGWNSSSPDRVRASRWKT